jgi:hypothetical protein
MQRPPTFIRFLSSEGLLSYDEAKDLTDASSRANALLGQMMLRRKHVSLRQMAELLERQASAPDKRIGELAIEAGHIDQSTLDALLEEQATSAGQHPIDALRRRELMTQDSLFEAMCAYIKLVEEPAGQSTI